MKNLFKEKNIGVFGFGVEGRSLINFLLLHGVQNITVFDEKIKKSSIFKFSGKVVFVLGDFSKNDYSKIDIAFRSPGIAFDKLKNFLPDTVQISSPTNLFFENHLGKIVAVTGTKGKSTTALIISEILRLNGKKVFTGGNIGVSALDFVDQTDENSYSVLELSSFQICDLKYSPDIAVILPISSDHLDYHKNEEEYLSAKMNLINRMQSEDIIISYDSPKIRLLAEKVEAKKTYFSENQEISDCCKAEIDDLSQEKKIPRINLIASCASALALNLKCELTNVLNNFKKMSYRIEFIGQKKSIKFYNDSAATNPISTIEAMKTMVDPFALILGGSSKNIKFSSLANAIKENKLIESVYLIGQTANEIENELNKINASVSIKKLQSLKEFFSDLKKENNFSAVLFSPACASFDQFLNYAERGKRFNDLFQSF